MALEHRISELDTYLFAKGRHYEIYEKMGAHLAEEDGKAGTYFSVWAPNARSVSVVGDFNNWDRTAHPMQPVQQSGIWDIFVPGVKAGDLYKFAVETSQGYTVLKADPLAISHSFVRIMHLLLRIYDILTGRIRHGGRRIRRRRQNHQWQFMKCIRVHGRKILPCRENFIILRSWRWSWRIMFWKWVIRMWS